MNETNDTILLKYLQAGNIITTRNAPEILGIADVRANIRNLRDKGIDVKDKWVSQQIGEDIKQDIKNIGLRYNQYLRGIM